MGQRDIINKILSDNVKWAPLIVLRGDFKKTNYHEVIKLYGATRGEI